MPKIKNWFKLFISIVLCEGAGIIGSIFTFSAIPAWYQTLNKPVFSPPNSVFGPVWTTLYFLMGISVYLIWASLGQTEKDRRKVAKNALLFFWIHLLFNVSWSVAFFGLRSPFFGLINIVILWVLIAIVLYKFWRINKWAGALLLPYLAWVSFATILNLSIWLLNK